MISGHMSDKITNKISTLATQNQSPASKRIVLASQLSGNETKKPLHIKDITTKYINIRRRKSTKITDLVALLTATRTIPEPASTIIRQAIILQISATAPTDNPIQQADHIIRSIMKTINKTPWDPYNTTDYCHDCGTTKTKSRKHQEYCEHQTKRHHAKKWKTS